MESWVIINFFIAMAIGAIIGLEREIVHQKDKTKDFGGIRNFTLISMLGFILAYFSVHVLDSNLFLLIGFVGLILIVSLAYFLIGIKSRRYSTTSEISAIIIFILSAFIAIDSNPAFRLISIMITIIIASLLAFKKKLHILAKKIEMRDVFATIKMSLISLVILPLLPNKNYSLTDLSFLKEIISPESSLYIFLSQIDVFNPFKIWLIVILITGLSFIGYFIVKILGEKKGLGLTGFLGGLVSSTATTVSMSKKSKGQKRTESFALAIILASSMMFIRIITEVLIINKDLIPLLIIPFGAMAFVGFVSSTFLYSKRRKIKERKKFEIKNPFEINTAIKFGLFYLFVLFFSKSLYILFGDVGIYGISIFSGLADVDAITITLSSMALTGEISSKVAVLSITLAAITNTLVKVGIVKFLGEKKLFKKIIYVFSIILLVGLILAVII